MIGDSRLKVGDEVRIRALGAGEWARAVTVLASGAAARQSVMIVLIGGDGLRTAGGGFYLNAVPLIIDYEQETVEGLLGGEFEIEVAA